MGKKRSKASRKATRRTGGEKEIPSNEECLEGMLDASMQALELISDLGFDHDGEDTVAGLRKLVEEMAGIAVNGLQGERPQYVDAKWKVKEMVLGKWKKVPKDRVRIEFPVNKMVEPEVSR